MSVRCVVCTVSHENKSHKIVLFPGISIDELNSLTRSVFQLEAPAIGFQGQVLDLGSGSDREFMMIILCFRMASSFQ